MALNVALRSFRKEPSFAVTAIVTLALGIGANTAVFSVVHAVLLRGLPFGTPEELVTLHLETLVPIYSKAEYLHVRERTTGFSDVAAAGGGRGAVLVGRGDARAVITSHLSANMLPLLRTRPLLGRAFDPADETSSRQHIAAISDRLWRAAFGGDPTVVGHNMTLETEDGTTSYTVVGVFPQAVQLLHSEPVDVWFPVDLTSNLAAKNASLSLFARRDPSVSLEQTQAEFDAVLSSLRDVTGTYPPNSDISGRVVPLDEWVIGQRSQLLWLLLGASGFVLLIACANVVNLFLVRCAQRRREFALRTALGAARGRIMTLVLAEGLIVAVAGAALGIALAGGIHDMLLSTLPADLPRRDEIGLNGTVLAATTIVSILAACAFAFVPWRTLDTTDLRSVVGSGGSRAGTERSTYRTQRVIITLEIALAIVLTAGTGLMIRTVATLRDQDTGLQANDVMTLGLSVQYPEAERVHGFFEQLVERTRALPGVANAALTYHVPLSGSNSITTIRLPDHPTISPGDNQTVGFQIVSNEYFDTMGIPLLRGRVFSPSRTQVKSEIIVSETFAARYWPNDDPIGKVVTGSETRIVVGVVGDTRHRGPRLDPRPEAYFPMSSFHRSDFALVVRSTLPIETVAQSIRAEVAALDPNVPITSVQLMDEVVTGSIASERHVLQLLGAFAILAVALGAIGVYGVVAYSVSQRRREFGIRLAVGARASQVTRMIMAWGLGRVVVGVTGGILLSLGASRFLESQLFGVSPTDAVTLVGSAVVLTAAAAAAAIVPSVRAARIPPAEILRDDAANRI